MSRVHLHLCVYCVRGNSVCATIGEDPNWCKSQVQSDWLIIDSNYYKTYVNFIMSVNYYFVMGTWGLEGWDSGKGGGGGHVWPFQLAMHIFLGKNIGCTTPRTYKSLWRNVLTASFSCTLATCVLFWVGQTQGPTNDLSNNRDESCEYSQL